MGLFTELLLKVSHRGKLCLDFRDVVVDFDFLLATRAIHEIKVDSLGAPAMAEKVSDAISVKKVSTAQLNAWLISELAEGADLAIIFFCQLLL